MFKTTFLAEIELWNRQRSAAPPPVDMKLDYTLNTILCSEMYRTYEPGKYGVSYDDGHFVVRSMRHDVIDRCTRLDFHGYDAANFQIQQPIYYFQGTRDVATPLKSARYHFDSQVLSRQKTFVEIKNRGHNPLQIGLSPCLGNIFSLVFEGRTDFDGVIVDSSCRAQ